MQLTVRRHFIVELAMMELRGATKQQLAGDGVPCRTRVCCNRCVTRSSSHLQIVTDAAAGRWVACSAPSVRLFVFMTTVDPQHNSTRRIAIANGTCVSWVRPWDNRSKCHIDEKRIQCLSNASQHVFIYLQPFPSNSTSKFKSSPFYHIFGTFWPPLVTPLGQSR